jgi:hypothetical protein
MSAYQVEKRRRRDARKLFEQTMLPAQEQGHG